MALDCQVEMCVHLALTVVWVVHASFTSGSESRIMARRRSSQPRQNREVTTRDEELRWGLTRRTRGRLIAYLNTAVVTLGFAGTIVFQMGLAWIYTSCSHCRHRQFSLNGHLERV